MYFCNFGVLYYKLLFLMRLSDSGSFSVYMNISKKCFSYFLKTVQKCEQLSYEMFFFSKNVCILVFSVGNITGIFGGNISGVFGGNY